MALKSRRETVALILAHLRRFFAWLIAEIARLGLRDLWGAAMALL